jgi:DNA repair protein RadC
LWFSKSFKRAGAETAAQAKESMPRTRGFAEATMPLAGLEPATMPAGMPTVSMRGEVAPGSTTEPPFPSTGPHGHRARMREKLLNRGSEALADYELLEMLLFFAQPKGDTKPLAKAVINKFGSFAAALAAPQKDLFETPGLGTHSVAAIKLVQAAACGLHARKFWINRC